jgi:hypothetical protein
MGVSRIRAPDLSTASLPPGRALGPVEALAVFGPQGEQVHLRA